MPLRSISNTQKEPSSFGCSEETTWAGNVQLVKKTTTAFLAALSLFEFHFNMMFPNPTNAAMA